MQWFYVHAGQKAGPVSDAQLDELLRLGTINETAYLWREGMVDWQPMRVARPGVLTLPPIIGGFSPMPIGVGGTIWRVNNQVVTRSLTPFPDRCVRCNAPANGYRLKRTLYWHPPAYFFLILFPGLLIYAIVAMCIRKNATLHLGLCDNHRVRRKQGIAVCWIGVLAGIGLLIGAGVNSSGIMALLGLVVLLGGMIYGGITGIRVAPAKITDKNVWLKGVNLDFLAEFPEWRGPQ